MKKRVPYDQPQGLGLVVGFLSLVVAIYAARAQPAQSYELSIYTETPLAFWVGIGVALLLALGVALSSGSPRTWGAGLLLGGLSGASVVGLPLLRSYFFYGYGDSLTHLGWAREIESGSFSAWNLIYPGIHSDSVLLNGVTALPLTHALLVVVLLFSIVFFVFVPLIVRAVTDSQRATTIAAFSAFLLLPITTLSTHLHAHPFSQNMLFSTFVFFLVLKYITTREGSWFGISPTGTVLSFALVGIVLYHPQTAVALLVVFVTISLVQFVRRRRFDHVGEARPLYAQTAVLGIAIGAWITNHPGLYGTMVRRLRAGWLFLLGDLPPGQSVATQSASLSEIGVSLFEMFFKLLFVPTVYFALAGLLVLGALTRRFARIRDEERVVITYLTVGLLAVIPLFVITYVGSVSEQFFRYLGLMIVFVTILGALGLYRVSDHLHDRFSFVSVETISAVVIVLLLPLAMLSVFPSPYVYSSSQHVTEAQMNGFDDVFQYSTDGVPLADPRGYHSRYHDALYGVDSADAPSRTIEGGTLSNVQGQFDGSGYVVVSETDYEREVVAYDQLRFSRSGFESLDSQRRVSRVLSNRAIRLYYVS